MLLMDSLALLLYGVFAVFAFGWRTYVQWRLTGDTGLRLHARLGTLQWWSKLAFIVAIAAGVAAPVAALLGLERIRVLDVQALRAAGAVVALVGIATTAFAQWQMGASWRIGVDTDERTQLVTRGVFGYARNPIFTAMLLAAIGFAFLVANVVGVIGVVALAAALEVQVRGVEEPYLRAVHGADYLQYAQHAGRFLPGLGWLTAR